MQKKKSVTVATGVLRMHPRGFGFLQPDNTTLFPEDIFVPKHLTKNAVDGDTVEVEVLDRPYSPKGPEGQVVSVLKRSRTHVAGTIWQIQQGRALAFVPLFGASRKVFVKPLDERPLQIGDRLILKVLDWGEPTYCEMSHYLGHIDDPSCDTKAAAEEFGLRTDFSQEAIRMATSFGTRVQTDRERVDLSQEETFTIDPDEAKDFDDALSLSQDRKGNFLLLVHIADVSHYVQKGSPLDVEAAIRCNSTYLPGHVIPMLPHELSSGLCSLKEKVKRLTVTVEMLFDRKGNLKKYSIYRSIIKSQKRFTYKEAKLVLDGKKKSPFAPTLTLMVELCKQLKEQRHKRGSIEFILSETIVKVDAKGNPVGLETIEYDITHQLVEEFMLKANEIVALHLTELGEKLTYRVHDEPSEESMKEFAHLARAFGFSLPKEPKAEDFQKLFAKAEETPFAAHLATSFIRSMRLAYYSPMNSGHFGLSLTHYCHFTSPIRRYVDLVVHRILLGESQEAKTLGLTCHACSEQERISARAEQAVVTLKKFRLLKKLHEEDPARSYQAVVTRVKNMGVLFEVQELQLEGFLHVSELTNDYFVYHEKTLTLTGRHTGVSYRLGTAFPVKLKLLNFILLESKWELSVPHTKKSRKKK